MARFLRTLGFARVEETLNVLPDLVIRRLKLMEADPRPRFTSSCPVVVDLVKREFPSLVSALEPSPSPMVLHAASLKSKHDGDSLVVFIGPCLAKKNEAQRFTESAPRPGPGQPVSADLVLTFAEVWPLIRDCRLPPPDGAPSGFDDPPPRWAVGALYRVGVSGLDECRRFLASFPSGVGRGDVVEVVACAGGCRNGPGMFLKGGACS